MTQDALSFEKSFERLEKILETMNSGKTPLDESLKLYEEAEKLMQVCTKYLNEAEQKVEKLVKGRNGEVCLDVQGRPCVEPMKSLRE